MWKDEVHLVESSKCNVRNKVVDKIQMVSKSCFLVMINKKLNPEKMTRKRQ